MAGSIGGGGLGDLAIRYGYQRFRGDIMLMTVIILVLLVQGIQMLGDAVAKILPSQLGGMTHEKTVRNRSCIDTDSAGLQC